jgi:hypothetical protein
MSEWIAAHPREVILLCEAIAAVAFMAFVSCLIWQMNVRSKEASANMKRADDEHQKTMATFRRRHRELSDLVSNTDDEVIRRVH